MQQCVRVVAVLDGPIVPAWVHRVLLEVARSEVAELAGAVLVEAAPPRRGFAFRAYEALDRRLFAGPDDALAPVDASGLLERAAVGAAPNADVLLKLTCAPLPAGLSARLGVWSFDHLEQEARGGVAFFAELARGAPVTGTCLRAQGPHGSRVLARSWGATDPTSLSRGRNAALWKSSAFVARALRATAAAETAAAGSAPSAPPPVAARAPGARAVARFAGSVALRVARERLGRRRFEDTWFVALRRSRGSLVDGPLDGFEPIPVPSDRFYADPFLVPDGDRLWLFFEDGDRASGKAVIRCAELRADGRLGASHVVIECDYHLSYPFVFRSGGAWFMLPESSGHRTVELWRAVAFPWHWELDKVLLSDVKAVDPTLLEHEGRLWLFAASSEHGASAHDELLLFHADSLDGEWRPHAGNPVVSDVRYARPAGPFFHEGGRLYRPSQDCSGRYGSAFWIQRVERLDEHAYRETPVRRVAADWCPGLSATHSIHRAGGFDAIDGRLWLRRGQPLAPAQKTE
jgi:hypothetical protein